MIWSKLTIALIPLLAGGAAFAREKDSCFDCHSVMEGTSIVYKGDVHHRNKLGCADCHGGDQQEDDQNLSMNASRGFKVRVTRAGMPEYCGRCHEESSFMSHYKPHGRVDQLALYQKSVHGRQLAAGHKEAAECVDCHGVHNIRGVKDPRSPAHPKHLRDTCAKCHEETAELFGKSAHGKLFNNARTPSCTVCHASHATETASIDMLTSRSSGCAACHKPNSPGAKAAVEIALFLSQLEAQGPGASEALARARVAVHTLDLASVRRAAETPSPDGKGSQAAQNDSPPTRFPSNQ